MWDLIKSPKGFSGDLNKGEPRYGIHELKIMRKKIFILLGYTVTPICILV